jgi:DNA-binding NarL/FixJ family response regulator
MERINVSKLRIFLADDHAIIREGLKSLINAQPDMEVIGEADNGRTTVQRATELQPDIVVMDVSMPELNGIAATERLKQKCPHMTVLALTMHDDKGYLGQVLKAGASGYVLKRAAFEELTHAIRMVAGGGLYLDPKVTSKFVGSYIRKRSVEEGLLSNELSNRETEVLRLIARGYSNKEIAAQLDLSVRTVETYKVRLMEKLDLHNRADIVRYALHQGWLQDI